MARKFHVLQRQCERVECGHQRNLRIRMFLHLSQFSGRAVLLGHHYSWYDREKREDETSREGEELEGGRERGGRKRSETR